MKVVYFIFAAGIALGCIAYTQRLIYWICKCIEGKRLIKTMRPSNSHYKRNYALYRNAKIQAVCWSTISIAAYLLFLDCIAQAFKG